MIDHYDSFTYNLVQCLLELNAQVIVRRSDAVNEEEISKINPNLILLSPGPGTPDSAFTFLRVIERFKNEIPIFGVCLGHQAIAQSFGAKIIKSSKLYHGKSSEIFHDSQNLFENICNPMIAMRYHSLIVDSKSLPQCLTILATSVENEIMALQHKDFPIMSVQFHPESIGTKQGKEIMKNLIKIAVDMNERTSR